MTNTVHIGTQRGHDGIKPQRRKKSPNARLHRGYIIPSQGYAPHSPSERLVRLVNLDLSSTTRVANQKNLASG